MNCLKTIAGSSVALLLTFSAPIAWGQSEPNGVSVFGATGSYNSAYSTNESGAQMDQNLSRQIKQAWSEGKDATLAMSFQENGEIALGEGRDEQAKQYFRAGAHALATPQPAHSSNTSYLGRLLY